MSERKDDNVEYFPGKPGFYKKGPGEFKLTFGTLEDFIEEAEEKANLSKKKRQLESVPDPQNPDGH